MYFAEFQHRLDSALVGTTSGFWEIRGQGENRTLVQGHTGKVVASGLREADARFIQACVDWVVPLIQERIEVYSAEEYDENTDRLNSAMDSMCDDCEENHKGLEAELELVGQELQKVKSSYDADTRIRELKAQHRDTVADLTDQVGHCDARIANVESERDGFKFERDEYRKAIEDRDSAAMDLRESLQRLCKKVDGVADAPSEFLAVRVAATMFLETFKIV
jgi:DNA repair ATPase RecN